MVRLLLTWWNCKGVHTKSSTCQSSLKHWHAQPFQSRTIWNFMTSYSWKLFCHLWQHVTLKRYNYKKSASYLIIQGIIRWVNEFFCPTPLVFWEDENLESPAPLYFALQSQYFCHILNILFDCLFLKHTCWKQVRQQITKLFKISYLSQQKRSSKKSHITVKVWRVTRVTLTPTHWLDT